jgi:hypothetical protein
LNLAQFTAKAKESYWEHLKENARGPAFQGTDIGPSMPCSALAFCA